MGVYLGDDGTLDTVFVCDVCGREIRYSEIDRDEDGCVLPSEFERVAEEHADECSLGVDDE